jgi:serine O-acetyltransferase
MNAARPADAPVDRLAVWQRLQQEAAALADAAPPLAVGLGACAADAAPPLGLGRLLGRLLRPVWLDEAGIAALAAGTLEQAPAAVDAALEDLQAITGANFEPGGLATTFLSNRGFHVLLGHRVLHALWQRGDRALAEALRASTLGLGADIHPAARIGRRIFLDHAIGVVVGETAAIGDDCAIWHGVTLGSTLFESGDRHPKLGRGVVVGAGATILGNIAVGDGAVIAAGSVVTRRVPPCTTVAGNPAAAKAGYRHPYGFTPGETPS